MKPNIFGTVALPLKTNPFKQWRELRTEPITNELAKKVATIAKSQNDILAYVNKVVNNRFTYVKEEKDSWKSVNKSFNDLYGDCEDYAIAKYKIMKEIGFSEKNLFLTLGELDGNTHHAILTVDYNGKFLYLDNSTNEVLEDIDNFVPVMTMNTDTWIHGVTYDGKS